MAIALKEFSVPLALLLIAVLVYLLIIGKLNGWSFAGSLFGVGALVAVIAVVLPRSEDISEVGVKVGGQELLFKMEKVRQEIYAKADEIKRLTEQIAEISAFNLAHLGRFSPNNLDELLLNERDRLVEMLRRAGVDETRIRGITSKITNMVTFDLARDAWAAVPKEIFSTGPAKGKDLKEVGTRLVDSLIESKVGTAEKTAHEFLKDIAGWTPEVKARVVEFDAFRQTGVLPARRKGKEEE